VQLPNGIHFSVGTGFSDSQRGNPPPVGSTITFRYQELSDRGVPRFPSFVRVRNDLTIAVPSAQEPASQGKKAKAAAPAKVATTAAKASATPEISAASNGPRYFEFVDDGSAKFWEIATDELSCTVRYGRIGTAGTTQTKTFTNDAALQKHYDKLVAEKMGKGYTETKPT
jgi:DNA ligase-1